MQTDRRGFFGRLRAAVAALPFIARRLPATESGEPFLDDLLARGMLTAQQARNLSAHSVTCRESCYEIDCCEISYVVPYGLYRIGEGRAWFGGNLQVPIPAHIEVGGYLPPDGNSPERW